MWDEWKEGEALGLVDDEEQEVETRKRKRGPTINSKEAMLRKWESVRLGDVAWIETMSVDWEGNHSGVDEDQDLQRELAFYNQAAESVKTALQKLQELNVPVDRPDDYFAEMVKSDEHMEFIRAKLAKQKARLEKIEQKKKDAEMRKFGKGKQALKRQEKQKEKKREIEQVKSWSKKRKQGAPEATDDELEKIVSGKKTKTDLPDSVKFGSQKRGNKKREHKDKKFGQNAKKKGGWRQNDADSAFDMSAFSAKKNKTPFPGMARKGKPKTTRPGKRRRQDMMKKKK